MEPVTFVKLLLSDNSGK